MEDVRLFNELRTRTVELGRSVEELKMLSEVGRAVSSTLNLRAILSTILTRSVGVAGADAGAIFRYNRAEHSYRLVEEIGWDATLARSLGDFRIAEAETRRWTKSSTPPGPRTLRPSRRSSTAASVIYVQNFACGFSNKVHDVVVSPLMVLLDLSKAALTA
jgi:hypothetical protein